MHAKFINLIVLAVLLICRLSVCLGKQASIASESSKYLNAVRTFADNVLKYGRDTYGPKHTPLFVDGLNIHTLEPVKWIDPDGTRWILSNLASQQNLFRTLDGLTRITGDPKYKQAAMDAIKYAFDNLRSPNGLLYWGHSSAYDALGDKVRGSAHVLKSHDIFYELMWEVDANATRDFIDSFWAAHILDWSNLDMNRIGRLSSTLRIPKGWNETYKGGHVFFDSWPHNAFINTGTDLFHAAAFLAKQTGEKEPLIWAKRLAYRYVETRHPSTGISSIVYNQGTWANTNDQLLEDFKEHFGDPRTTRFPPLRFSRPLFPNPNVYPWICYLLVGDMLDPEGKEFTQWALEELTAWGKFSYRREDNSFVPILTDGKRLERYILKKDGFLGPKGMVVEAIPTEPHCFLAYSMAYRLTGDEFMWQMVRDMAHGYNLGEIGTQPGKNPDLNTHLDFQDPCLLLGFLELSERSRKREFLEMACRIGENILANQFHKGFFPLSKRHIYASFQALEPLALLYLQNEINSTPKRLPRVWPSMGACFTGLYRDREFAADTHSIYTLTESTEPPVSLQEAAFTGDVSKVRSLIVNGAEVNAKEWGSYLTALQRAAMKGHEDVVKLLLAKGADIDAGKYHIGTALHYVAENGFKEISELLISKGADINATNNAGDTPLHSAANAGHKEIVELLIDKGANVNAKNSGGQTPLDIALSRNRKDIVELLVEKGAVPSSIHADARLGDLAGAKALLEKGVDVNDKDEKGMAPLHYAAQEGHKELAEFLIAKGANVNGKDKYGYTPLNYAMWYENKDIIKLLITKRADVNLKPEKDYPPLHYAIWNEDAELVKLLVDHGAKFYVKDMDGWTAFRYVVSSGDRELLKFFIAKGANASDFHTAAWLGDLDKVKRLVEQGTDVNTEDEQLKWTPLHWAAFTGPQDVLKFLLAKGANVNAKDEFNSTPLQYAAVNGYKEFVELLLAKGVDVNATDNWGSTPLHAAARKGHEGVVELLIAKGATVNTKDRNGRTPLYRAAMAGHRDIVEILVANGANIDTKDKSDRTALHMAAMRGRNDVAELLIAKGAYINSRNANGQTPLHLSVSQGRRDMVELLIAKGADVNARNKWNRTPLDIAVDRGHTEIVELLRKHGAKQ